MEAMNLKGGLDTGNGYMKGLIQGEHEMVVDFPTVCSLYTIVNDIKAEGGAIETTIKNIFNQMDISISSNLVPDGKRRILGKRAIKSGSNTDTFNVNKSHVSKAQQEMSFIMVFGTFAGAALKDYYETNGTLPEEMIPVKVKCILSLPITEYRRFKDGFAGDFKNGSHMVTFHNFTRPIRVELTFEEVIVMAEGATAQYAITHRGVDLESSITPQMKNDDITSEILADAENVIGIDIGEGTVNFVVFQDGLLSPDASGTLEQGYGTLLDDCVEGRLKDSGFQFNGRKALADFLITTPKPLNRAKYKKVKEIVDDEAINFSENILRQAEKFIASMGASTEVIFVYGGGSIPLRPFLEFKLEQSGQRLSGIPIVYIEASIARTLNAKGLYMIANELF